jgi:O-methyltransferase
MLNKIISFENHQIDASIINKNQIEKLIYYLLESINNKIDGDIVEFGCYVGESSKYLMKTLIETNEKKKLFVYDSFEGLPDLSSWEENTGWTPRTLKTSEDILINNFTTNKLPLPIIHKDWFKNIPENKIPEKISFAFLDGDFYDSIYDSLTKIYDKVQDGGYICFHDYKRNDLPGVNAAIQEFFRERNIEDTTVEVTTQLGVYRKNAKLPLIKVSDNFNKKNSNNITLVTGLWDIKRDTLTDGWSRSFQHYLNKFEELLKIDENLIIFGDDELEKFVWERRSSNNTQFVLRHQSWFVNNDFYDKIQKIRQTPSWYNQSGWLPESTQAKLEMYNPLVMSKMFLLHDAKILDKFDSSHLFWIDAGITNTIHSGYFTHDKVLDKIKDKVNKFSFICFPYDGKVEIHGFEYNKMCQYSNQEVDMVARGGFFGGTKDSISDLNSLYYSLMNDTLSQGYMGTEESLFTILTYRHPDLINYYEIENNGLLGTFFENVKNDKLVPKTKGLNINISNNLDISKVGLYVITFNSPKQFETLIKSMLDYDSDFITKTKKFLLDNSTDLSTTPRYVELCEEYNFEHIKKVNLGICGGRQFVSDHFNDSDLDVGIWSEDDMFFQNKPDETCRNGFNRYTPNLYQKCLEILQKENFDVLKLNFSEFFGDSSTCWAWYNVPQGVRQSLWPDKPRLPVQGLDPNAPLTEFKNIKSHKGLPYVTGKIYYSNWTHFITKEGNRKMFQETKWGHPFENTWMSHIYQETIKGKINPGLLLLTPIEHNRFHHYAAELRKES